MLCRYYVLRLHFTAGCQSVVFFVLGSVAWGTEVEDPPSHVFCCCLCLWDFASNPWIICESYVLSPFT
jgi:hypothetical protein